MGEWMGGLKERRKEGKRKQDGKKERGREGGRKEGRKEGRKKEEKGRKEVGKEGRMELIKPVCLCSMRLSDSRCLYYRPPPLPTPPYPFPSLSSPVQSCVYLWCEKPLFNPLPSHSNDSRSRSLEFLVSDAWCRGIGDWTGWPSVSVLWLGEISSLICSFVSQRGSR